MTEAREKMTPEACVSAIIATGRPFLIARVALDEAYHDMSMQISLRCTAGESLSTIMDEEHVDDTENHARALLQDRGPCMPDTNYDDWFMLRATLGAAKQQRLFLWDAYDMSRSRRVRERIKPVARRGYGELLCEALDRMGYVQPGEGRLELATAVNKLAVLTALNRGPNADTSAVLGSGVGSTLFRSHAQFKYIDRVAERPRAASLRVVSVLTPEVRDREEGRYAIPRESTPRITVESARHLGTKNDHRRTAHLLAKEHKKTLSVRETHELEHAIAGLEDYIVQNADRQRVSKPISEDAV